MSHRYLGDSLRHPRRRLGPHLPAPRERDRAVGGRLRLVRALLDALGDGQLRRREDVEVARQRRHHPPRGRDARPRGPASAAHQRALPQPGQLHPRARRQRSGDLSRSRRGRGPARLLLPHARAAGRLPGPARPAGGGPAAIRAGDERRRRHGRRFQHRGGHRAPLRRLRAGQQAARRSQGHAQAGTAEDPGRHSP